jgi:hypothetical protein
MEGTKHEKITLVVLGYIIGAATVFVAMYIPLQHAKMKKTMMWAPAPAAMPAPAIETPPITPDVSAEPATDTVSATDAMVTYADNALRYINNDNELVLSIHESEIINRQGFEKQGFHTSAPVYSLSPDEKFVFFCEQHTTDVNECNAFVYDITNNTIQFVQSEKVPVTLETDAARAVTWNADGLVIADMTSVSQETPWVVK